MFQELEPKHNDPANRTWADKVTVAASNIESKLLGFLSDVHEAERTAKVTGAVEDATLTKNKKQKLDATIISNWTYLLNVPQCQLAKVIRKTRAPRKRKYPQPAPNPAQHISHCVYSLKQVHVALPSQSTMQPTTMQQSQHIGSVGPPWAAMLIWLQG